MLSISLAIIYDHLFSFNKGLFQIIFELESFLLF